MATVVTEIPTAIRPGSGLRTWCPRDEWYDGQIWRVTPEEARMPDAPQTKDPVVGLYQALREYYVRQGGRAEDLTLASRSTEGVVYVRADRPLAPTPAPTPAAMGPEQALADLVNNSPVVAHGPAA